MAAEKPGNQTPDIPDVSETELRETKVDELRTQAKEAGVQAPSKLRKDELVQAMSDKARESGEAGSDESSEARGGAGGAGDAGPDDGRVRTGPETSRSIQYSQEMTSPDEDPERDGRSLVTTSHQVIRTWAEERGATPATVEGTEHDDHLGVLRFDFGGGSDNLRHVDWSEWFQTFDARKLNFIYQENRSDGTPSNFFRLESPHREDA